jgi:hypothetical protein
MKHRDKIIELRNQGKSYKQIKSLLGCSLGTICYHLGSGQKEKHLIRDRNKRQGWHPFHLKMIHFKENKKLKLINTIITSSIKKQFKTKIEDFCRYRIKGKMIYNPPTFTLEQLIEKVGENPICYLTGQKIDISQPKNYSFDHIVPRSQGGDNSLENLGLCTKQANLSKTDMTLEEYLNHCKKVLETHGFKIESTDTGNRNPT